MTNVITLFSLRYFANAFEVSSMIAVQLQLLLKNFAIHEETVSLEISGAD